MTAHASARATRLAPPRAIALGAGALVAVGYVDPGNWATDIASGSRFAYAPLSIVVASSLVAILLQSMSARLGIATGRDLATLTREAWPRAAPWLWLAAELAIVATDLAEVLGSALALKLLFGVPIGVGVALTALDVAALFALERCGARWLVRVVASMLVLVAFGLAYEIALCRPCAEDVARGLVPTARVARDPELLYAAVGILGATVMPHNLYLHSSLVLEREGEPRLEAREARAARVRSATVDTVVSLGGAMVLNAAIVVVAAAAFHATGHAEVADIEDAHRLLAPLLGSRLAPVAFAVALLAAGQSATITGTLAGQSIMSGFLRVRWPAWQRRVVTRACAIVPALVLVAARGDASTGSLLVTSQVILSLQLPFAMVPLVRFASDARRMGALACPRWVRILAWACVALVVAANGALLVATCGRAP